MKRPQPAGGSSTTNVLLVILIGLVATPMLLCGGCVLLFGWSWNKVQQEQQEKLAEAKRNPITVAPDQLDAAYRANEVAADQQYKDKWLRVTGQVTGIDKGLIGNEIIVKLAAGGRFTDIWCYFPESASGQLARLNKGDTVTILGRCRGRAVTVSLDNCELGQ